MSEYKVSVIVPVYNTDRYLAACIESIINQTYKNLEILIIDDGSTDTSLSICMEYASRDERIRVVQQENMGVSAARNKGLAIMTGDFFLFVDSDDELKDFAIEFLLKDILEHTADMASAVKCLVNADGTTISPYDDHRLMVYSGLDMLKLSLGGERQTNSACAKLYRASFFRSIRFEQGRKINEDGFFLFQCYALKPKVVQHNENVYLYNIRAGSNSRSIFSDKYLDILYFCERKKDIVKKNFPELADELVTMEVSAHLFFLQNLCRTTDRRYLEMQKASIKLVKQYYKDFYCMNKYERKMSWIVAHGLYPIYKMAVRLRFYR